MSEDGLRPSMAGGGALALHWRNLIAYGDTSYADRVARGRTLARSGRVQSLSLSPGVATAEVHDGGEQYATVRVATLEPEEWLAVLDVLGEHLAWPAELLEGRLPGALLDAFAARGVQLLPTTAEVDSDCHCGDYAVPCAHAAAMHQILADAMDGDPFVLFTLRGRPRSQLLGSLSRAWGGAPQAATPDQPAAEPPPQTDWYRSPSPLPAMSFRLRDPVATGLSELGPLQGDADLHRALEPLLEAGRTAALAVALIESQPTRRRKRARHTHPRPETPVAKKSPPPSSSSESMVECVLTERLVDRLAEIEEGSKSRDLAMALEAPVDAIRNELLALEKLGIVFRTGQTRGTRWWLG